MHPTGNINLNKTRLIRLIYVFKTQEPIYSLNMYASGKTASIKRTFCHFRVSRKFQEISAVKGVTITINKNQHDRKPGIPELGFNIPKH